MIHAGIYYPSGSLKASMCVSGREKLYRYVRYFRDLCVLRFLAIWHIEKPMTIIGSMPCSVIASCHIASCEALVSNLIYLCRYAEERGIPYHKCGKLIVATDPTQHQQLRGIQKKAGANGVHDLKLINPSQVAELEPEVYCTSALLSPSTGVIDSHALMIALQVGMHDSIA